MNTPIRHIKCPQCKQPSEWSPQNPYRPFCSERCRMIDLGAWARGDYVIAGEPLESPPELDTLS